MKQKDYSKRSNPAQLLKFVDGSLQRYFNESLNNLDWKDSFLKKIKPEIEKIYNERKSRT